MLKKARTYGPPPFETAVVHGGPGAAGEMAPVAREMGSFVGVLEPLQAERSLEGQVQELKRVLEGNAELPVRLIGFSWGAWLSYLVAARYPPLVGKVILVGSGPFEEKYASAILETRLSRLGDDDRPEVESLLRILDNPATGDKHRAFIRLGKLLLKADSYDPLPSDSESIDFDADLFQAVWREGSELRKSGQLLELGRRITCPVVAIHGDYDPHPAEGVRGPLGRVVKNFRFVLLRECGHKPWLERRARDRFYEILKKETAV